jgi:PAS domain-containing protein
MRSTNCRRLLSERRTAGQDVANRPAAVVLALDSVSTTAHTSAMGEARPLEFDPTSISEIGHLWNDPDRLVGIAETDGTRHWYLDIAPSCERILGYTRDELLAMSPADIVESTPEVETLPGQLTRPPAWLRFTARLRHKKGHIVTVTARAQARVIGTRQLVLLISEPVAPRQWEASPDR